MKIDWESVKGIDDKKDGDFRSRIIYKDGRIEPRTEKYQDLSRGWHWHLRRALTEKHDG
jgi:hypothetical protein